jgi:hypothetical protein
MSEPLTVEQTRDLCVRWMERYRSLIMEGVEGDAAEVAANEIGQPVMMLTAWTVRLLMEAFDGGRG